MFIQLRRGNLLWVSPRSPWAGQEEGNTVRESFQGSGGGGGRAGLGMQFLLAASQLGMAWMTGSV